MSQDRKTVPADLYDERYYTICEGYDEFAEADGLGSSARLEVALGLARVGPGMRILDMGCGRGEMLMQCAAAGAWAWGLDYSPVAARIARETAIKLGGEYKERTAAQVANVKALPFPDSAFDRVFMLDLVEHLFPWELDLALADAWRILKNGGQLVVHTMPNRWYYQFGYPLYRLLNRLRGQHLPKNPRARFEYHEHAHVNEQDILRLRTSLKRAGFEARVWVDSLNPHALGTGRIASMVQRLVRLPGLRLFLCNDLLAVASKAPESHKPS